MRYSKASPQDEFRRKFPVAFLRASAGVYKLAGDPSLTDLYRAILDTPVRVWEWPIGVARLKGRKLCWTAKRSDQPHSRFTVSPDPRRAIQQITVCLWSEL